MDYQLVFVHCVSGNTAMPVSRVILKKGDQKFSYVETGEFGDSPVDVTLRALVKVMDMERVDPTININGGSPKFKVSVEKDGRRETGESEGSDFFTELGNAFVNALNKF